MADDLVVLRHLGGPPLGLLVQSALPTAGATDVLENTDLGGQSRATTPTPVSPWDPSPSVHQHVHTDHRSVPI